MIEALRVYLQETLGVSSILGTEARSADLYVVLRAEVSKLPLKESELLTRILEAGLKVSMSRVHWLTWPSGLDLIQFLNDAISQGLSKEVPLLVFGGDLEAKLQESTRFGQIFEVNGLQVLVTHGLREISESESIKRDAWTCLQKLKGLIPAG
jgi:hypothetical protein